MGLSKNVDQVKNPNASTAMETCQPCRDHITSRPVSGEIARDHFLWPTLHKANLRASIIAAWSMNGVRGVWRDKSRGISSERS